MAARENTYFRTVKINDIVDKWKNRRIYIYGMGDRSIVLMAELKKKIKIYGVIDEGKCGQEYDGLKIEGLDAFLSNNKSDSLIVIGAIKYSREIVFDLMERGLEIYKDFVLWEGKEDIWEENDDIKEFVQHNKRMWNRRDGNKRKIIVDYLGDTCREYFLLSYVSNVVAERYKADIYMLSNLYGQVNEVVVDIYQSFGVKGVIGTVYSKNIVDRAEKLVDEEYPKLKNFSDWKNFELLGLNFGKDLVRTFVRMGYADYYDAPETFKRWILNMFIKEILFWNEYLATEKDIGAIVLDDGIYRNGILRRLALSKGIPVYAFDGGGKIYKCNLDMNFYTFVPYYKEFYNQLSHEEKIFGLDWAKERLESRLFKEETADLPSGAPNVFTSGKKHRIIKKSNKTKIVICNHIFDEDCYSYGWQLFSSQMEWLHFLGKKAEETKGRYDWYFKPHPQSVEVYKDTREINKLLKLYPSITLLDAFDSPIQMKEEGMDFALTIWGEIGFEYPALGINVIQAGNSQQIAFDFSYTPKSISEYNHLLDNLEQYRCSIDYKEILQFYCMHFWFCKSAQFPTFKDVFGDRIAEKYKMIEEKGYKQTDSVYFRELIKDITDEEHIQACETIERILDYEDNYEQGVFYKRTTPLW